MSTLSTNQIVVEYIIKEGDIQKAQQNFDKLSNAEKQAIVQTQKLNQTLKETATEGKKATDQVAGGLKNVEGMASKVGPLLAGAFSIAAISAFTKQVIETTIKFEGYNKAIEFGSGNAENFAKNQEFLNNLINKYGLGLASATEAYKQFFTASNLAGQSQEETNRQFEAVTKAGTVLKLTTDQMQGAFMALGQMMSKGTVQAEELRGQLGERIPGAFSIMAKALNVNEQQLGKMLEQGQVLSKTALPAFARELEKTFGPAAEKNLNGMVNSQNRFNNAIDNLILAVGNKLEPFLKGAYDLAAGIANQLSGIGEKEKKVSTENLGRRRAEADLVKQLIKYGGDMTVQNSTFIRQQEAVLLLLGMEEKIDKQLEIVAQNRIKAAGDFGGVAKQNLVNSEKELAILKAEEEELAKIAGIEVKRGEEKKALSEADIKALQAKFQLEEKRLELLTQIRKVEMNSQAGNLGADKALYDAKLELRQRYTAKGLKFAKEETDLLKAQSKKTGEDLIQQDLKDRMVGKNILDQYHKDSEKSYDEYLANLQKKKLQTVEIDKSANKEFIKDEKEKWQEIINITEAYSQLANNIVQGFANLRQQQAQNELAALNKKYDAEIRLAGDNEQKVNELNEKKAQKEREIRTRAFEAQRMAAVAEVVFRVGPIIAQQIAGVITAPLAIASYAAAAAQIGFILAQPTPEFKEGTKGKPFKGGKAIVGEIGKEWVVTTSGQVYETPGIATLVDLPKGSQVIPHNEVVRAERYMGSKLMREGRGDGATGQVVERLMSIENTLSKLPITSLTMDEKGFTKKIQTKSRETRILNNRFGN